MNEKEHMPLEEKQLLVASIKLPQHKASYGLYMCSKFFGRELHNNVGSLCEEQLPTIIDITIDQHFVTNCSSCDTTFIWTDRTQSWTQT